MYCAPGKETQPSVWGISQSHIQPNDECCAYLPTDDSVCQCLPAYAIRRPVERCMLVAPTAPSHSPQSPTDKASKRTQSLASKAYLCITLFPSPKVRHVRGRDTQISALVLCNKASTLCKPVSLRHSGDITSRDLACRMASAQRLHQICRWKL